MEIFGFRLKKLRTAQKMNQTELSKIVKVNQVTISSWEKDKQEPSMSTLAKLAIIFDVKIEYLMGYDKKTTEIKNNIIKATIENIQKLNKIALLAFMQWIKDMSKLLTETETMSQTEARLKTLSIIQITNNFLKAAGVDIKNEIYNIEPETVNYTKQEAQIEELENLFRKQGKTLEKLIKQAMLKSQHIPFKA
jgi:transcriptional regulator with XRE-family HTH domain